MRIIGSESLEDGSEKCMRMILQEGALSPKSANVYGDLLQAMLMRLDENKKSVAPFKQTPGSNHRPVVGSAVVLGDMVGVVISAASDYCTLRFPGTVTHHSTLRWDSPAMQEAFRRGLEEDVEGLDQRDVERTKPRDVCVEVSDRFTMAVHDINELVLNQNMTMEAAVNKVLFSPPVPATVERGKTVQEQDKKEQKKDEVVYVRPETSAEQESKLIADEVSYLYRTWSQFTTSFAALVGIHRPDSELETLTTKLETSVTISQAVLSKRLAEILRTGIPEGRLVEVIQNAKMALESTNGYPLGNVQRIIKGNNGGIMPTDKSEPGPEVSPPSLATRVKKVAKRTAAATTYRVAASQISQTVRATMAEALAKQGGGTKREITTRQKQISKFLDTEVGLGLLQILLGSGMELIPGMTPDGKLDRLADELRISGTTKIADAGANALLGPMRDMIRAVIATLPDEVEEATETPPRVRAHVHPEHRHDSQEESHEHNSKGNSHAARA